MGYVDSIVKRIQQDIKKYGENRKTVRAGIIDVLTVRYLSPEQMHVNPDDEFSDPKAGPSEEIVERYIDEARSGLEAGKKSFAEPIMVAKLSDGDYMIVNGHHRWAAAIKVGLTQVRVVIVNPGWENLAGYYA